MASCSTDFSKKIRLCESPRQKHSIEDRTDQFSPEDVNLAGLSNCSLGFEFLKTFKIKKNNIFAFNLFTFLIFEKEYV